MPFLRRIDQFADRHPRLVPALGSAALAAAAWAVGALGSAWGGGAAGLWPLGAVMLGWLLFAPGPAGASGPGERREASIVRAACALCAAATVAVLEGLFAPWWHAARAVAAGVIVPALAAEALARLATVTPPRGVGSVELRLLAAGLALAPPIALLRGLRPGDGGWSAPDYLDMVFGDLLVAVIGAPLGAALARPLAAQLEWVRRARASAAAGEKPSERPSPSPMPSWQWLALALAGIAACALAAAVLHASGRAELARTVAVGHLVIGLLAARSVSGVVGALLIGANALAMAASYTSAFEPAAADDLGRVRELGAILLLAGVFALQSMLHAVSCDSREAARTLIRQAMHSDLSGLPNHRALARIVGARLEDPRRGGFWLVGVVLPDIARWSDLLDSAAAAELERSVAGRLRATFEPLGARVAHPSSGRFVLTLGERIDGLGIRQRLRSSLGGRRFDISEHSIQLRYHAGMVEVPAGAQVGADAVLTALSMSLQRAADDPAGIHRATLSATLVDEYRTELRTIEAVGCALAEGRVHLFAELIEPVRPLNRSLLHFEVLARVEGADGRLLQPSQFMPAIWHAGLHGRLDRLVFVRTVAYLASNRALHDAVHLCAINVCGPTLCDPEFPDYVKRCLASHAVDPRRLMIEITESSEIADLELAREHVTRLSEMGLAIALDDFGTGLATFDYLKRLRADVLKIDGSFIRNVTEDPLDREIVATIVRIARATGARTVAEWIETPQQRAIATELGVDHLQGRLIAAPVPIESLVPPSAERAPTPGADGPEAAPVRYEHGEWHDRRAMGLGSRGTRRRDEERTPSRVATPTR